MLVAAEKEKDVVEGRVEDWRGQMTLWERAKMLATKRARRGRKNWAKVSSSRECGTKLTKTCASTTA